ncbi:MAG: 50S ribosomal protein L24 [SAR202 cluster bacterium]|nr:50S ribosomal protein L24 [SAR202 cluster bacterium]
MTKLRTGDTVRVLTGKDRGKQGRIQRLITKHDRVLVEGVNMVKRHRGRTTQARQGGIVTLEAPVSISKVALVCPRCGKAARVGFRFLEDGRKVRSCQKCHETID